MIKEENQKDKLNSRFKISNNAFNEARHLVEDANNGLSFNPANIAECYIKQNCNIALEFKPFGVDKNYRTFIQRTHTFGDTEFVRDRAERFCNKLHLHGWRDTADRHDHSVFVRIGELVEVPEQVIPSSVWLETVNDVDMVGFKFLYFSLKFYTFKFIFRICDRETNRTEFCHPIHSGKITNKDIERRSQMMNDLACDNDNIVGRFIGKDEFNAALPITDIHIGDNFIRWLPIVGRDEFVQINDVLIGPFGF